MFFTRSNILFCFLFLILLAGLLTGCSSAKPATTGGFKISVFDSNNQSIIGAKIVTTIQPEGQLVVSGITSVESNPLDFEGLLPGQYSWKVSKAGYTDTVVNINIVAGQSTGLSVTLNPVPVIVQ